MDLIGNKHVNIQSQAHEIHVAQTLKPRSQTGLAIDFHDQYVTHFYKPLVDRWALYDNAGEVRVLIATGGKP